MNAPIFSRRLDADPAVKTWLATLNDKDRAALRDDVTPSIKEIGCDPAAFDGDDKDEVSGDRQVGITAAAFQAQVAADLEPEQPRLSEEVLDALDPASADALVARVLDEARKRLPAWQFPAFALWFQGDGHGFQGRGHARQSIARQLGVSRATVRSALDGGGHSNGPGAIAALTTAILDDDDFKKAVGDVASKNIGKRDAIEREQRLSWFKGLDSKPTMVVPLAMLLVIDALADARREVKVADIIPHFPRSTISQCMGLLRAHGFASTDGHTVKIHNTPCTAKEEA